METFYSVGKTAFAAVSIVVAGRMKFSNGESTWLF